jgi:hypothetical protein
MALETVTAECAVAVPELEHRRKTGVAKESHRQYSGARDSDEAQNSVDVDLKSVLLSCIEAGVFDDLIREALPTGPGERDALRQYLQHLLICMVHGAWCVLMILKKGVWGCLLVHTHFRRRWCYSHLVVISVSHSIYPLV